MRVVKWIMVALAVFTAVVAAILGGGGLWLARSVPADDRRLTVSGPAAVINIERDSRAMPYIVSQSSSDGFYAIGYLHARDRLFQMDLMRRSARGTLAEVLGSLAIDADIKARTYGMGRIAEENYAAASPALKAALDAYAAGVNRWITEHKGPLPPEYTALMFDPAPWRPSDTLAIGRLLAMMLGGNWKLEALRASLASHLPADRLDLVLPPTGGGPALDGSRDLAPFSQQAAASYRRMLAVTELPAIGPGASNVWVVAGSRTQSGKPILASDPHLGLSAPGLWYMIHLKTPDFDLMGGTIPGIPFPLIGQNGRVAWGQTTMNGDASDLFIETPVPGKPDYYRSPTGDLAFTSRSETVKVRFGDDRTLTIRESRHGPVIATLPDGRLLTLAHAGLRNDDRTAEALLGFINAKNADDFVTAARDFMSPAQNLAYADRDGHIGLIAAGRLPIRAGGTGRLPADGASGVGDWTGWVPFEALPQIRDPASGVVFNANNAVSEPGSGPFIGADFDEPYRARRIAELIGDNQHYTIDQAEDGQNDIKANALAVIIPRLVALAHPASPSEQAAIDQLRGWDFRMTSSSAAPLIATAWVRALTDKIFAHPLGADYADWQRFRPQALLAALDGKAGDWCQPAAAPCAGEVQAALTDSLKFLDRHYGKMADWRWGTAHQAYLRHGLFDRVPGLSRLTRLDVPTAGGDDTLMRGAMDWDDGEAPFANRHAAGLRVVLDLAEPAKSRVAISTGQSGNPYSPHWGDLVLDWAAGRMFTMPGRSGP